MPIPPDRAHCCCFTGHRPQHLPWGFSEYDPRCYALKDWLRDRISEAYRDGYRHFYCGMALGCDLYFCEAVLAFRANHPDVTIEAAIPCTGQAVRWTPVQQERYRHLCVQCDSRVILAPAYTPQCMHARDRYMVDRSSRILAVYDGTPGGTRYTLAYAMKEGLSVCLLDPGTL